jgi:hypothetical protein
MNTLRNIIMSVITGLIPFTFIMVTVHSLVGALVVGGLVSSIMLMMFSECDKDNN